MTIPELISELEKIYSQHLDEERGDIDLHMYDEEGTWELRNISYDEPSHSIFFGWDLL